MAVLTSAPLSPETIVVEGDCHLADAILAANSDAVVGGCPAGSGPDVLELTDDVLLTVALPAVTDEIVLAGNGFTIAREEAAAQFRILDLQVDGDVALREVTLTNGSVTGNGGGILNAAGRLTITASKIVGNEATGQGGGISSETGSWALFLTNSTISDNAAGGGGGGLLGRSVNVIKSSTFSGNSSYSTFGGGGLSIANYTRVTLDNSTLSGNFSDSRAAGLDLRRSYGSAATLVASTLVGNTSGGIHNYDGFLQPTARLFDTLIAANSGYNCNGPVRNLGGSFDDDGTCDGASPVVSGVDFDPGLADNGGLTETHALLPGSVAVDGGSACGLTDDQRGLPRSAVCDSGSVELATPALEPQP